jgi:hypothetical protein
VRHLARLAEIVEEKHAPTDDDKHSCNADDALSEPVQFVITPAGRTSVFARRAPHVPFILPTPLRIALRK